MGVLTQIVDKRNKTRPIVIIVAIIGLAGVMSAAFINKCVPDHKVDNSGIESLNQEYLKDILGDWLVKSEDVESYSFLF